MEVDDISVVLTRASQLHSSICDAIDRASNPPGSAISDAGEGSSGLGDGGGERETEEAEDEVCGLEGIRDALEVLETQLGCLQSVQQQQQTQKDAALAELEESRRVLLQRLRQHEGASGTELLIQEAMAFAGEEPTKNRGADELALPPYLFPVSLPLNGESPIFMGKNVANASKQLEEPMYPSEDHHEDDDRVAEGEHVVPEELQTSEKPDGQTGFATRLRTGVLRFTGKAVLVVISVIAFVAISDFDLRRRKNSQQIPRTYSGHKSSSLNPNLQLDLAQAEENYALATSEYAEGQEVKEKLNGGVKRMVKERVELPFPRRITTPDVLHGRG